MKKYLRDYALLFVSAGLLIFLDQWTKYLVRTRLVFGEIWSPWDWLTPYARVLYYHNTGAAFGLFQGFNAVFTILAVLVSAAIIYYFPQVAGKDWLIRLALCLQLGGAIGNLIDRVTFGQVVDFISVGTFPVFNVADSCITVGVGLLLMGVWLKETREKKAAPLSSSEPPPADEPLTDPNSDRSE